MGEFAESIKSSLEEARKVEMSKFEEEAENIKNESLIALDSVLSEIYHVYNSIFPYISLETYIERLKFYKSKGLNDDEIDRRINDENTLRDMKENDDVISKVPDQIFEEEVQGLIIWAQNLFMTLKYLRWN